jgi:hypothetical protein
MLTGRYAPIGMDRIAVLAESGVSDTLSLAGIQALAVRGRHTRTGAIVGGAAGLAAGIFFGYVIGAVCDAADCDRGRPYLLTIPLFGAGGTLLGAGIGAAIPKWKRVLPVRRAAGILGAALLLVSSRGSAQTTIGEFRLMAVGGAALRATGALAAPEFPPPGGRALGGVIAGLSFVRGSLSMGPEAMLLRGSDRRMYQLGGVARLGFAKGIVRPFVVVGGGVYGWDRKWSRHSTPRPGPGGPST